MNTKTNSLNDYTLFIEGVHDDGETITVRAATEKAARSQLWASLTDEQQNRVVQIECLDTVPVVGG